MRINLLRFCHGNAVRVCLLRAYRAAGSPAGSGSLAVVAISLLPVTGLAQTPAAPPSSGEAYSPETRPRPVPASPRAVPNGKIAPRPHPPTGLPTPSTVRTLLRQGDDRVRVADMRGAALCYARAAENSPRDPLIRLALGVTLAERNRPEDAVFQFRKAVELAEDDVIAALLLRNALMERGDNAEAQDIYLDTYRRFGRKTGGSPDATTSIVRLRAGLRESPGSPILHLLLGDACQLSERWPEADAAYEEAIRLAPNWVKPRVNLGLSRLAQNRAAEAIALFEKALKLDPGNVQAQLWKGDAQLRTGQSRQAITTFQRVSRVGAVPVTIASQAMTGIGRAYANVRQDTRALTALDAAQKLAPNDPTPSAVIGEINLRNGDAEAAVSAYDTALRITRDGGLFAQRPVLYRSLAEALLSAGNARRAEEVLAQALTEEPGQASLWHRLLAHVALKSGDPDAARRHLRNALEAATGPYPLETLRAIDAQGFLTEFRAEYRKQRELQTVGRYQETGKNGVEITVYGRNATNRGMRISATAALANIARYRNETTEEITLRRELTALRENPWDWFLLAEIYDRQSGESGNAREAYLRALEQNARTGGLTEAALQWAKKRNAVLTETSYKPK
ncbi:MAG: tetratricopeptide repeat protein [Capsulimonadales bacterium]|nr:tetratricopeptide repeat protein [Capsulimonadales bacterium]